MSSSSENGGLIAAIVLGWFVASAELGILIYFVIYHRKKQGKEYQTDYCLLYLPNNFRILHLQKKLILLYCGTFKNV